MIDQLYKVSCTPKNFTEYFENPELIELLDFLLKSDARTARFGQMSDAEIKEMIMFFLDVVNTPESLRGLLLIEPCVTYLLVSAGLEAGLDKKTIKGLRYLEKEWFTTLRGAPHAKKHLTRPDIEESALFRYHLDSHASSKVDDRSFPSLYKSYGYFVHKTIRFNMRQPIDENTKQSYARRGRQFFKYTPQDIKARRKHPGQITADYIEEFATGYDEEELVKFDGPLSETATDLMEDFIRLINFSVVKPKPHSGHEGYKRPRKQRKQRDILGIRPVSGNATILDSEGHLPVINAVHLKPETKTYADEEEKLADSFEANPGVEVYEFPEGDITKKPSLKKRWADLINLLSYCFFWDIKYLNLFHYSLLHMRLRALWNRSSFDNAIIGYLYILIHTGIDHVTLLYLSKKPKENMPTLLEANGRFFILLPMFIKTPKIEAKQCLPTSDRIRVPIPDPVAALMSSLLGHGSEHVFSYKDEQGEARRLSLDDVISFLDEEVNDVYSFYDLKITPSKIYRSFYPMYQHRFGLDPLICVLVSGEDHHRLHKSQLHYVYIEHALLEKEYLGAFERVTAAISKNIQELIAGGFVEAPEAVTDSNSLFPLEVSVRTGDLDEFPFGYCSPIICWEEYVFRQITTLKEATAGEKNFLERHNYFAVYADFCAQFASGLRPRNNPEILFDYDSRAIAIQDKQSAKYHEERIHPPANVLSYLLKEMGDGVSALQRHIAKYLYPPILAQPIENVFFFVDPETGRIKEFTLKRKKEILKGIGIDFSLPPNFPRHFMKNYFYHEGLSNDLIDAWLGHQHHGRELLSIISATIPGSAAAICLEVAEAMLRKIGFVEIGYSPQK